MMFELCPVGLRLRRRPVYAFIYSGRGGGAAPRPLRKAGAGLLPPSAERASSGWRDELASGARAVAAQLLVPAIVGLPGVCLAWNAAIRSAISSAWVVSAKWPVSRR